MNSTPIDKLITIEKEAQGRYSEMMEKASLSNIRYFLKAFSDARNRFARRLEDIKNGKNLGPSSGGEKIIDIHATEHLLYDEVPDLSSLSSTLLFISTQEKETYDLYLTVMSELPEGPEKDSLRSIINEREQVKIKADRLYHDLVQTSY